MKFGGPMATIGFSGLTSISNLPKIYSKDQAKIGQNTFNHYKFRYL